MFVGILTTTYIIYVIAESIIEDVTSYKPCNPNEVYNYYEFNGTWVVSCCTHGDLTPYGETINRTCRFPDKVLR